MTAEEKMAKLAMRAKRLTADLRALQEQYTITSDSVEAELDKLIEASANLATLLVNIPEYLEPNHE